MSEAGKICENCAFWYNRQAELNYVEHLGICIKVGEFDKKKGGTHLLNREKLKADGRRGLCGFESVESLKEHKDVIRSFCFVSNGEFGCNRFKEIKKTETTKR